MSTRATILIKDESSKQYFYRHSDGYPSCTGESLKEFVKDYQNGKMRTNVHQSCGWLIIHGREEYAKEGLLDAIYSQWKVGAYEPIDCITEDSEYLYIIDLDKMTLEAFIAVNGKKKSKIKDFETISFKTKE